MNKPIFLKPAYAWRTYMGGKLIARLHGEEAEDSHFPEEWLLSVVRAANAGREEIVEGLSETADGRYLKDLIESDPAGMLGERHAARWGEATGVLAKILDAAERLGVQVHPTREKAQALFHSPFGKTESWYIIDTRTIDGEESCIYLGFKEGITREHWEELFHRQDVAGMLDCLHRFPVKKGDVFLVTGGTPHAIGRGCLLVEIQEPTDYTINTERYSLSGVERSDSTMHRGLGFEKMFECFDYLGRSMEETDRDHRVVRTVLEEDAAHTLTELVGYRQTPMFCLQELQVRGEFVLR
ncbi:MAG: class I mannose-6-phosphate isomerase, partial [Clostridia bacterium]|nr:class I mannose-6-phosphate isomerase [Clostridia bacterium]